MTSPADIPGADALIDVMGRWPSFHDCEVHHLTMQRLNGSCSVELVIHIWRTLAETDSHGYFNRDRHHLITLRCTDCQDTKAVGFNQQNAIFDLKLTRVPTGTIADARPWHLDISTSFGLALELRAAIVEITQVQPCDDRGNAPAVS